MKTFKKQAAQGDLLITKIDALPCGVTRAEDENGEHIVAHSETGHNHVLSAEHVDLYQAANDPFIAFAVVHHPTSLRHLRSFDTHSPIKINPGIYRINRQREYTPEGYRRAQD
jgi:hypothetical protein